MENWYVLHSKPNAEYQVAEALKERGIQTYLPEVVSAKAEEKRRRKPFFPCYLFVRVDLEAVGLSQLRWLPGLRRFVAFDGQPLPLADELIDLIREKLAGVKASGGWPAHTFQPGDTVRITQGPLQGMLAVFDTPTTPAERVQVLLTFLGQASRTWVSVTHLEKGPSGADVPTAKPPRRRKRGTRGGGRRIKSNGTKQIRH